MRPKHVENRLQKECLEGCADYRGVAVGTVRSVEQSPVRAPMGVGTSDARMAEAVFLPHAVLRNLCLLIGGAAGRGWGGRLGLIRVSGSLGCLVLKLTGMGEAVASAGMDKARNIPVLMFSDRNRVGVWPSCEPYLW